MRLRGQLCLRFQREAHYPRHSWMTHDKATLNKMMPKYHLLRPVLPQHTLCMHVSKCHGPGCWEGALPCQQHLVAWCTHQA